MSVAKRGMSAAFAAVILAIAALGVASTAIAKECIGYNGIVIDRKEGCFGPKGGGGDVPVPFGLNSKVELADGENYLLIGRIRILNRAAGSRAPRVLFEVDLNSHPWLDSKKRRANPHYPIEGSVAEWQPYEGQRVKFSCRAVGKILQLDGSPNHVIFLQGVQAGENHD